MQVRCCALFLTRARTGPQPALRATWPVRNAGIEARSSRCRWPGMTCARQNGAAAHPARVGIAAGVGGAQVGRAAAASPARPSGHSPRRRTPRGRPSRRWVWACHPAHTYPRRDARPSPHQPMLRLALSVDRGAVPVVRPCVRAQCPMSVSVAIRSSMGAARRVRAVFSGCGQARQQPPAPRFNLSGRPPAAQGPTGTATPASAQFPPPGGPASATRRQNLKI